MKSSVIAVLLAIHIYIEVISRRAELYVTLI
jgi:hypothetical protein